MKITNRVLRNYSIVAALGLITLFLLNKCGNSENPVTASEQTTDTIFLVVKDTVRVFEGVKPADNQIIKEVIVEVPDKDAQELIELLQKEKEDLSKKIEDYKRQLAENGTVTHTKEIHTLADSIITSQAALHYEISAEGRIYQPYFSLDVFKSDTIQSIKTIIEKAAPKTALTLGYGLAYDGKVRNVVGLGLSRKWAGFEVDYVVPNEGDRGMWIGKVKATIKLK